MAIKVSYYGSKKPGPSVKPQRVIKLPDNVPRDKLPFGQHNPIDWMTGKHLFRLRDEDRDKSRPRNVQSSEADDDRYLFPVDLVNVEGEGGSAKAPATWKYDVRDMESGALLLAGVDPTAAPHQWRRPEVGAMKPATYGYAYFDDGDDGHDKMVVLGWINEAKTTVVGDADIAVPTQDSIETRTTESDGDVLQLYDFDDPPEYTVPPYGSKPKIVLRDDVSSSVPSIAYGAIPDLAESILDEFTAGDGISIDVYNRTISVDAEQIAGSIGDILDPPEVPPPCGHPGNEPGAGGESDDGDDTEHPGDEPGAGGGDTDHPGDSPSPPSSGECP
jgi:hypothetical protein